MQVQPLAIEGAFVVTPRQFPDDRGVFLESFRGDLLAQHLGHRPDIIQTNVSVSSRADEVARNVFAHPTLSEAVKESVHGIVGHMINL
ncbi:dihydrolipoamide dehydrogenase [Janibacter sp. HTCC2649]|uniref:dTDP-4-dehydrorhamnose 3,5-epimerase family protein n=1 Tax=Janibacter sp. HTCC2649 TaxID=313589 RepID=UPI0000670516|nr:dTDP-4-dehydrorhamnose 3,5-epimerase family protein [Janibacter sp. HTCC2649]EAP96900.1 dihydrolipoamide dehydrogenase [Janibacter sp. HTCC2649]